MSRSVAGHHGKAAYHHESATRLLEIESALPRVDSAGLPI
jgi:hypothetical protein